MEQTSDNYISDTRVMDAVGFIDFYMEEQLLEPGEQKSRMVKISIIYFNERAVSMLVR